MIAATRGAVKTKGVVPTKKTVVLFDAGRKARVDSFGAGILPPTRWTGQHAYTAWTQEEADWASECFRAATAAEVEAEEDAYNAMLDQMAFEDACVSRLTRGHCM